MIQNPENNDCLFRYNIIYNCNTINDHLNTTVNNDQSRLSKSYFHFFLACLRLQVNPANKSQFEKISPERAFADFIFAHVVLHLTVMNFIG